MAEMWYYTSEGKQMDPVPMRDLKRMISDGVLKPTDMVWKDGMPRWIRASSVKELYPDPTASLDQYFSTGKDDQRTSATSPPLATAGVSTSTKPDNPTQDTTAAPPVDDDEARPRVKKRREPGDDDDDGRDPKRKAKSGGSSVGIIIALLLGGGLLLVALVVGVIILVVSTQRGPVANPRGVRPPGAFEPIRPRADPDSFTKVVTTYKEDLPFLSTKARNLKTRKGTEYQVKVRTEWKGNLKPDIDLHIFDRNGNEISHDREEEPDCMAHFIAEYDGDYKIELRSVEIRSKLNGPLASSTVTIMEPELKKKEPKEPPLPPDVKDKSDVVSKILLAPGQDRVIKVRLREKVEASFTVTTHGPKARPDTNHLYVLKEDDDKELASDRQPKLRAQIKYTSPTSETVRIRVVNTGTTPSLVSVSYNLGP